jgi:transcriptional regulator with XRE-family HTH domain
MLDCPSRRRARPLRRTREIDMGETRLRRDARRRALELRRAIGGEIRRLREDAGLTRAAVARAAGIDPSYLGLIEDASREAGYRVLSAIGAVLGADLSVRLFPTTGPRIHDRFQAAMEEALLRTLHRRWIASPEVPVLRPARGVIDVVLGDRTQPLLVAGELNSQIRRLEQQVRWHREKEQSLPSADLWRSAAADGNPVTSRLLVLRSTHDLRELARAFEATLAAAYPARAADVVAALTTDAPWLGAGIAWMRVDGARVELLGGPPRGVGLGR